MIHLHIVKSDFKTNNLHSANLIPEAYQLSFLELNPKSIENKLFTKYTTLHRYYYYMKYLGLST